MESRKLINHKCKQVMALTSLLFPSSFPRLNRKLFTYSIIHFKEKKLFSKTSGNNTIHFRSCLDFCSMSGNIVIGYTSCSALTTSLDHENTIQVGKDVFI